MRSARHAVATLGALVVCASPSLALACPVCFSATDENRTAYLVATLFMTLFPLALIGTLIWFVREKYREADEPASSAPETGNP